MRTGPLPYIAVLTKRVAPLVARAQELRLPAPELDVHDLLATARRQALLEDFGPGGFRPGLDLLVDSINADVRPDRAGAQLLRELIGAQLRNRVGVRDWSKKNPDSRIEAISAPIVICGLPGSGVDLLAGLIGHDAETRVLRLGEALVTAPPGGALPETYRPDPRRPAVADLAQRVRRVTATGDSGFPEPSLPAEETSKRPSKNTSPAIAPDDEMPTSSSAKPASMLRSRTVVNVESPNRPISKSPMTEMRLNSA